MVRLKQNHRFYQLNVGNDFRWTIQQNQWTGIFGKYVTSQIIDVMQEIIYFTYFFNLISYKIDIDYTLRNYKLERIVLSTIFFKI